MSDGSQRQLDALREVVARLEEEGLEYWLFGGWAVDFHAGRVTRPHDDLDLAIWLDDLRRVVALLESDGWAHAPDSEEDGGTGYERGGVRLELTFLVRDAGGVYTPLRSAKPRWSDEALGGDRRELAGIGCRVVSLAALERTKARARDDPEEAAKDAADHGVLAALARG